MDLFSAAFIFGFLSVSIVLISLGFRDVARDVHDWRTSGKTPKAKAETASASWRKLAA